MSARPEGPGPAAAGGGGALRVGLGEAAGAVADLGVLVPLAAALILVNGLDPGAVFVCAGLTVLGSGLFFRVPFPVQPLKALTAVAVASLASPEVIHAAGIELGLLLLLLSLRHVADAVARLFTKPVVRALQLGVGVLLVLAAARLALRPPEVFRGVPPSPWPFALMLATGAGVALAAHRRRYGGALALLGAGLLTTLLAARPDLGGPAPALPSPSLPDAGAFARAFLFLVVPQLPLTFGNAVVAVSDLAREEFGPRARRVTPSNVCRSAGVANVLSGVLGGMPMCHGAGGLTAHVRLGARTAGMNVLLGGALLALGALFPRHVLALLGLLPVWGLAGFLAYAGIRHALLVRDLRGSALAVAVVAGALGAWLGNLAVTAGLALLAVHGAGLRRLAAPRSR